ncbi:MAG: zinc ribbon domain-containing protein [bacterium]
MLPLAIGTVLAVGALVFVLYPLFAGVGLTPFRAPQTAKQLSGAAEQEAVVALREIEFDRATGKLSDSDYDELRTRYTEHALDAMRSGGAADVSSADAVEAAVLAYRARLKQCAQCGPRPEPDAIYCSNCGHYLPGACASCGAAVSESAAAYCHTCGRQLAA